MKNLQSGVDARTYHKNSLLELAWTIEASEGLLSLILLRCNYVNLRRRMVRSLREFCSLEIQELLLPKDIYNLLAAIKAATEDNPPLALMVFGLESLEYLDRVLISANQTRGEFRDRFSFPLIFWVTDKVLEKLLWLAPDFKSWTTAIEFVPSSDELLEGLRREADRMFVNLLGSDRQECLDESIICLDSDSHHPYELDAALKDLRDRSQELSPDLQAFLEFVLGQENYMHDAIDEAIAHFQNSLYFWQKNQVWEREGLLFFKIGLCYNRQATLDRINAERHWETALDFFQKGLNVFERGKARNLVARFIGNLGEVLGSLQRWDELQSLAERALKLHQSDEFSAMRARDYGFLAEVALGKGNFHRAKELAETAIATLAAAGESQPQALGLYLFLLGRARESLGEVENAIANLEQAREEIEKQYNPPLDINILKTLRRLYFQQKDYLRAFHHKLEHRSIEQQYGYRAFIGAGRLKPQREASNPDFMVKNREAVAREIEASGRKQDVENLLGRIGSTKFRVTVIHGQSGVGKSSILTAGLVPALKKNLVGDRFALPIVLRVYKDWEQVLGSELTKVIYEVRNIRLSAPISTIDGILEQFRANQDLNLTTVLIFDQFEEFFFSNRELSQRRQFWNFIRDCLNIPFVNIVLSLREDALHYLLECNRLNQIHVIDNHILGKEILYYLGNFSPDEAKLVIETLTRRSQFYLQPELIAELVADLAKETEEVRPIEMQVVGAQLQTEKITTLQDYRDRGPKGKLVEGFLEEVIKDCGHENEGTAQLVLYFLTNEDLTRPLKTRAELATDLKSKTSQLDLVLEIFVKSGLVSLLALPEAQRYQLVHDYLVVLIRQKQGFKLEAELKQTQEKLREVELTSTLLLLVEKHFALDEGSQALVAAMKAGRNLQKIQAPDDELDGRTVEILRRAIYSFKECKSIEQLSLEHWIWRVSFSRRAQLLALASEDGTVKLWDLESQEIRTFEHHNDWVSCVSFSPNGEMLASAGSQRQIQLWRVDGALIKTLKPNSDDISALSFSPKDGILASASADGTVKLWNLDNGRVLLTFDQHHSLVKSVCFSPNGQFLASGGADKIVRFWGIDGKEIQIFSGHDGIVNSISFSPDGQTLASASQDRTVRLWELNGSLVKTFKDHKKGVRDVSFSPDGQTLASASEDRTVKLWSIDGTLLKTFDEHDDAVFSLSFAPDGRTLASTSKDRKVKLWQLESSELEALLQSGCQLLRENSPHILEGDRSICDGIETDLV